MGKTIKQLDVGTKRQLNQVDSSLPWRSSLEQSAIDLDDLQQQVEFALANLRDKQRRFVLLVVSGTIQAEAYVEAGYKTKGIKAIRVCLHRLMHRPGVVEAIQLCKLWHQLKYGISALWKRQQLVNLYTLCTTPDSSTWNPNAANKSMALLMQMDGDIIQAEGRGKTQQANIIINTGAPERIDANSQVNGLIVRQDGLIVRAELEDNSE